MAGAALTGLKRLDAFVAQHHHVGGNAWIEGRIESLASHFRRLFSPAPKLTACARFWGKAARGRQLFQRCEAHRIVLK
jgi:hypothetical protein